ncbi:MAG: glycosyltransferase family 2 protein [Cetobacterium sp.]
MLISVVVLTYNHADYLEESLNSIISQKGDFKLEVLIGNDNSPDKTKEILKKYEKNIDFKIFNREKNMGATKNLYDLLAKAKGKYVAILEGDDYWIDPLKLSKQLKILKEKKEYVMCFTDSHTVDKKSKIIGEKLVKKSEIKDLKDMFFNRGGIATGTVLFRNFFIENKNEKVEKLLTSGNIIGDLPLFSYLISFGKFYNLKDKTSAYRYIESDSTSYSAMAIYKKDMELERVLKGILEFYGENSFLMNYFLRTRRYFLKSCKDKEIKKKYLKELTTREKLQLGIFIMLSPLNNLKYSLEKRKYKK